MDSPQSQFQWRCKLLWHVYLEKQLTRVSSIRVGDKILNWQFWRVFTKCLPGPTATREWRLFGLIRSRCNCYGKWSKCSPEQATNHCHSKICSPQAYTINGFFLFTIISHWLVYFTNSVDIKPFFFPFRFPHRNNIKDFSETSPFAVIICGKACLRIGKIELNVWNREKFDQKLIELR